MEIRCHTQAYRIGGCICRVSLPASRPENSLVWGEKVRTAPRGPGKFSNTPRVVGPSWWDSGCVMVFVWGPSRLFESFFVEVSPPRRFGGPKG